ncbi:hypothetical protein OHB35_44460 [Streptomyces phaeochromogenes]|uniref:Methyltransferase domain-containing protein n=1 Tax=Streptomyces phaeochromogenes TaxID=1923 RepID=A0ABZ1HQ46_STRPH|nr:hypothetical protein [Streptomyces phaeochromogenes]WSD19728.1 hypothetical protein OHB35_44460 [Streptomyces phaeochromogenes]
MGIELNTDGWLEESRSSYDTVAASYADQMRNLLDETPAEREFLALFADLVHTSGGGPVADVGCGPGRITAHLSALKIRHLEDAGHGAGVSRCSCTRAGRVRLSGLKIVCRFSDRGSSDFPA